MNEEFRCKSQISKSWEMRENLFTGFIILEIEPGIPAISEFGMKSSTTAAKSRQRLTTYLLEIYYKALVISNFIENNRIRMINQKTITYSRFV